VTETDVMTGLMEIETKMIGFRQAGSGIMKTIMMIPEAEGDTSMSGYEFIL